MGYKQELDALGRWAFQLAGLRSHRLSAAPPQVARPVILWEAPSRNNGRRLGNYHTAKTTTQFAKLFVHNLDELADIIDLLEADLRVRNETLPVYENETAGAKQIGVLRKVEFDMGTAQAVDVPFTVKYEAFYSRPEADAEPLPHATAVKTRIRGVLVNE